MSMTELHANSFEDVVTEDGVIWDCLETNHIPDGSYRLRTVCPDYNNPKTLNIDLIWESDYAVTVRDGAVDQAAACRACLLYTSPSPRDLSTSRMPSSA